MKTPAGACEDCGGQIEANRIWPKRCDSCMTVEKHGQAPHIDEFKFTGWNEQLAANITSRAHQKQVIRDIETRANGQMKVDWH